MDEEKESKEWCFGSLDGHKSGISPSRYFKLRE